MLTQSSTHNAYFTTSMDVYPVYLNITALLTNKTNTK